jgi:hypothetical protein
MHYQWLAQGTAVVPGAVPWPVRFLAKFVLEILPAALASLIGGILFAHYQFGQPASPRPAREAAGPATAEMMRLIRDEHSLVHDFLTAQQSVEKARLAASAAEAAPVVTEAKMAEAAYRRSPVSAARTAARHSRTVVAAAAPVPAPTPIIDLSQSVPPPPPAPVHSSLVATTLALPGHVVTATWHAVSVIGGIPSWIGHRLGGGADLAERPSSASS